MDKEEFLKFKERQAKLDKRAKRIYDSLEKLDVFYFDWKNKLYSLTQMKSLKMDEEQIIEGALNQLKGI